MNDLNPNGIMKPVKEHDIISTLSSMPQASYILDINLEKLMYCAISIIHKHEMDNKTNFNSKDRVSITAENYYQLLYEDGNDQAPKKFYTPEEATLKKTRMQNVRRIMERAYDRFIASPVMIVDVPDSDVPDKVTMIQKLHYEPKTRVFSIQFADEFFEFFYNLLKNKNNSFSRHELKQVMKMNSYYALRLYRIFNNEIWRTNKLFFTYDELRRMFMKESLYRQHSHFKERVIEPAIDEINRLTNLQVNVKFLKSSGGKSFDSVEFDFDFKKKFISTRMVKALEKMKIAYAKKATPWRDDLKHFEDSDRINHFDPPTKLTQKQIKFLISSPTFMNDYGFFYENKGFDENTAKTIMKALLTDSLALVNTRKPIDLDYYFALNYKKKAENLEDGEEDDVNESEQDHDT